jgi:hypothetical protein
MRKAGLQSVFHLSSDFATGAFDAEMSKPLPGCMSGKAFEGDHSPSVVTAFRRCMSDI